MIAIFFFTFFHGCCVEQDVPKKWLIEKNINKIDCCGAKFYHVHVLGALDHA